MDRCVICSQDRQWHSDNHSKHAFTLKDGELKPRADETQRGMPAKKPPFDPILRFVLIDKGLITTEDLEKAERQLAQLGVGEAMVTRGKAVDDGNATSHSS